MASQCSATVRVRVPCGCSGGGGGGRDGVTSVEMLLLLLLLLLRPEGFASAAVSLLLLLLASTIRSRQINIDRILRVWGAALIRGARRRTRGSLSEARARAHGCAWGFPRAQSAFPPEAGVLFRRPYTAGNQSRDAYIFIPKERLTC